MSSLLLVSRRTSVVIVGAGPAGLTLANVLRSAGVDCVVLEAESRAFIEQRQRAGFLEEWAVRALQRHGLADRLLERAETQESFEFRHGGERHTVRPGTAYGTRHFVYPQPLLVTDLLASYADAAGGDVRFGVRDVELHGIDGEPGPADGAGSRPGPAAVSYTNASAGTRHRISCDFVAGCDGARGVTRAAVPGVIRAGATGTSPGAAPGEGPPAVPGESPATVPGESPAAAPGESRAPFGRGARRAVVAQHDHGVGWLALLAEAPPSSDGVVFGIHPRGFGAHMARSPRITRYYLECPPGDAPENWPDARVWEELHARLAATGAPPLAQGPIVEKRVLDMHNYVVAPMTYGRLYLAGDSAHLVAPIAAKGMNLALNDALLLADALIRHYAGDDSGLAGYSEACLQRVWQYQEFSQWFSELLHGPSSGDPFRAGMASARLRRLLESDAAATSFGELYLGDLDQAGSL